MGLYCCPHSWCTGARPLDTAARAFEFIQNILEQHCVQRRVGNQTLQRGILCLQMLELAHVVNVQVCVLFVPPEQSIQVKGLFRYPHFTDQFCQRNSHLGLLHHGHDLLHTESFPPHG